MSLKKVKSDLEIAQKAKIVPLREIAEQYDIHEDDFEPYGKYMAKINMDITKRLKPRKNYKLVLVSAITPTPLGEGKTVTTIGLSQGLNYIGKRVATCIRQPSLGPVFGIKGGAAGGGYSQVIPMEDFNLHLTGDMHAVGLAHNLCAAFLDNAVFHKNKLNIDPRKVHWHRVIDVSDRFLRNIVTGLGGPWDGVPRESKFDITAASEVMAALGLSKDIHDLRKRLARILLASTRDGKPVTAEDIQVAGAMTALLKDAIKPTLMQTLEKTPCFVHTGPFANIAHGNSSIIADMMACRISDYVVTESGFGADMGAEKFFNIKSRVSGMKPSCVVLVATVRALKMHSGKFHIVPGEPLDKGLTTQNLKAIKEGACNLKKHIENVKKHGLPVVVAINHFTTDTDKEIELIRELALEYGADDAIVSKVWAQGGKGGAKLAEAVAKSCDKPNKFEHLYDVNWSIKDKIEKIALEIYGAETVNYHRPAEKAIEMLEKMGLDKLPICMAKTHLSISHEPSWKGAPSGFKFPVRDISVSAGAGFIYPLCGTMRTMPGLPHAPAGNDIDINKNGKVVGLF